MNNHIINKINNTALTPFTKRVLIAITKIPAGQVQSYAQIAKVIGHDNASRAVGSACKHNPFVIIIPCHRVVPSIFLLSRKENDVDNYSNGGMKRKIELLRSEGVKFSQ